MRVLVWVLSVILVTPTTQASAVTGKLEVLVVDDQTRQPVEEAIVGVRVEGSRYRLFNQASGKDGKAEFELAPGRYVVFRVYKRGSHGFRTFDQSVAIEPGKTTRIRLSLEANPVFRGTILDPDGKPVGGVILYVLPYDDKKTPRVSGTDGQFEIRFETTINWIRSPRLFLVARYPDRNLAGIVELEKDRKSIEVKLRPGVALTGVVTNEKGVPLADAKVDVSYNIGRMWAPIDREFPVDKQGRFEIKAVPPGEKYHIEVHADGYGTRDAEVQLEEPYQPRKDLGTLALPTADQAVSGVVLDEDQNPVPGAQVICYGENQPRNRTQTDREGRFQIDKICKGSLQLSARAPTEDGFGNTTASGGDQDVRIVLQSHSSRDRVQDSINTLIGRELPGLYEFEWSADPDEAGKGKMVLVYFWDMSVRPSRHGIKQLNERARELAAKQVAVLTVHAGEADAKAIKDYVQKMGLQVPLGTLKPGKHRPEKDWGVKTIPWLILADKKHIVRAAGFGVEELDGKIKELTR